MKNTEYYKSGRHVQNSLLAGRKGSKQVKINKLQRINLYNQNPVVCKQCNVPLTYEYKKNKFCSKSCASIFNNTIREPRSAESKIKTSIAMLSRSSNGLQKQRIYGSCSVFLNLCPVCDENFYTRGKRASRKSCGKFECKTHLSVGNRTYANGRRKLYYYFNKHQSKTILLESTWEFDLAVWFDENNIKWIRPSFIKWYDDYQQKHRLYYPDFYLPDYHMYLDPKNPTAMKFDLYKMSQVSKLIPVIYGNVNFIKSKIQQILVQ